MTSIVNENDPNIKSDPEDKKQEEDIIDTKMEIDEGELIKGNITLINSDKNDILSQLQSLLEGINLEIERIQNISSFICDKLYKYRSFILVDIFNLIFSMNHMGPKIEFICLLNEIFKNDFGLEKNDPNTTQISIIFKKIIFPYAKGVCLDLFNSFIPQNQENVYYFLNEWEKINISCLYHFL